MVRISHSPTTANPNSRYSPTARSLSVGTCAVAVLLITAGFPALTSVAAQTAPGATEALFKERCAGCHEPNIEGAPSRAKFAQMAPTQIVAALDGVMAPMADGLTPAQKQDLAKFLGAKTAP